MKMNLGHCKLIWHHTNKQMAFEFMADEVVLTHDVEVRRQHLDPFLLQQMLDREPKLNEKWIEVQHTTGMQLECTFLNPAYGAHIAKRFIKRLVKNMGAKQLLLVPNYGMASKKESTIFWRAYPNNVIPQRIIFLILPTDQGERARRGV